MKNLFAFLALALFLTANAQAANQSMFNIDEARINTEMAELNQLEDYLSNNDVSYSTLAEQEHFLVNGVNGSSSRLHSMVLLEGPPLGISSFIWGFCLGLPGIAIVYFVSEDSDETKKALWGCVAGSLLYTVVYVAWYALWSSAAAY